MGFEENKCVHPGSATINLTSVLSKNTIKKFLKSVGADVISFSLGFATHLDIPNPS